MNPRKISKILTSSATHLMPAVVGNVTAEITGKYIGGPAGAAIGSVVSTSLEYIFQEFRGRYLSPRQKERVNTVIELAKEKISNNIEAGKKVRNDNFFINEDKHSSIIEIFEGIVLAAQNDHEEKKNAYYANLLANIAFDDTINRPEANFLLKIAQGLTYSQLCILNMALRSDKNILRQNDYRSYVGEFKFSLTNIISQIHSLYQQGLINFSGVALLGITDVNPSKMNIQGLGIQLYRLMELDQVPTDDVLPIIEILK